MRPMRRWMSGVVGLALLLAGCGERAVDWNAPENLLLRETSTKQDNGIRLAYWSLVDAPCQAVYDALVDIEHYPEFIPGVDRANILNTRFNQVGVGIAGPDGNGRFYYTQLFAQAW